MDKLFYNGRVHTMAAEPQKAEGCQTVQAIGVANGKVAFVGSSEEGLKRGAKEYIDLQGRTVLPGFNEGHMHLASYAFTSQNAALFHCRSVADCQETVRRYLQDHPKAKGVYARGFNEDYFAEKRYPAREELDAISTEIPIIMVRICGHMAVCNTCALEKIRALPEAKEEQIQDGILYENACELFYRILPKPTQEEIESLLLAGMRDLNHCGITTCQTDDFVSVPGADWRQMVAAYRHLEETGQMTVRIYEQCLFENRAGLAAFLAEGYRTEPVGEGYFRIGPLKLLQDGSLGAKTALLTRPYIHSQQYGMAIFNQQELDDIVCLAHENGMQIAIHTIGDGAMQMALDALEKAQNKYPRADARHGLVHVQLSNWEILQRMARQRVMAYIQPVFIEYDMDMVAERVGEGYEEIYAWKTMEDLGILTVGGSDAPIESFNVLENLYYAVTRQKRNGLPKGGWHPEQKVSCAQAVEMFTTHAAKACFAEEWLGRLQVGMLADMVVLSDDPLTAKPEDILHIRVVATVVGGQMVYQEGNSV